MRDDRNRRFGRAAAVASLILVFAATWVALSLTDDNPRWLTVETPELAVVGRPLEVRVTLRGSVEPTQINCTLHRANAERKGWGYLASSGPSRPAAGGQTFTFRFEQVPEREDLTYAFALIYLSPTGKWEDGTRAATAKYLPVEREDRIGARLDLRTTQVYRYPTAAEAAKRQARARTERPPGRPSAWVHPLLGLLLLAASLFAWIKARRSRAAAAGESTVWLAFAVLLAASAIMELSGIAGHITAWGRRLAEERGVYELRRPAQKAIMAAVAAAGLGLFILFIRAIRKPGPHRALWWAGIGLAAYLAMSFVSVLSFHAVDVARRVLWHGLSPVDAVRGGGAFVAFLATLAGVRRPAGRTLT